METQTTDTRLVEPLVARNPFRERAAARPEIMPYSQARQLLPEPVLPDRPGWVEMYWRAWELAWNHLRRPAPGSGLIANYIDAAANECASMWASCFMVHFGLYGRRAFNFMGTLDNFYHRQHADGFIGREINTETGRESFYPFDPNGTGPNIMAWAEWNYYRHTGQDGRLAEVFWPLMAFQRWMRAHRTWPSKLYWATGLSSGMDDQTRVPDGRLYHQHWTWVDANMQAALNCLLLGQMAQMLGEQELVEELVRERSFLLHEVNSSLWNEDTGFYQDLSPAGQFSEVKSIGAYWALLDKDMVSAERQEIFLRPLRDAEVFNRPHRIPAQAADDPGYEPTAGSSWRGGVWPPTNYMVLRGLRSMGQHRLAHEIALNHLENVYQVFQHTDTFWEYYAAEMSAAGEPARPNFVGWTGLTPIAILLEDVIGVQVDWPQRRVTWDRRLDVPGRYGVLHLPLGTGHTLDIVGDSETVEISSDAGFNLTIVDQSGTLQTAVPAGETSIKLE